MENRYGWPKSNVQLTNSLKSDTICWPMVQLKCMKKCYLSLILMVLVRWSHLASAKQDCLLLSMNLSLDVKTACIHYQS